MQPVSVTSQVKVYDAPQALRLLIAGDELDPKREKARLDSVRADLEQLKLETQRGELVPVADHEEALIALCSAVALRLGSIPSKAGPEIRIAASDVEAETILRKFLDEAREELAAAGDELLKRLEVARRRDERASARAESAAAAAKEDGGAVGGRRKGAVPGVRRRAGKLEDESS